MPIADTVKIASAYERKAAVLRAAELINCAKGSDEEREFNALTEAIAEFDLRRHAIPVIEIPAAIIQILGGEHQLR